MIDIVKNMILVKIKFKLSVNEQLAVQNNVLYFGWWTQSVEKLRVMFEKLLPIGRREKYSMRSIYGMTKIKI